MAEELTWGLCVATKDRLDVLKRCVECALDQTRPPSEVVVADSSADWEQHAAEIQAIVDAKSPGLPVRYAKGEAPSLTVQRNQAAGMATADILFMIDDDSLMHADCAAEIMAVYDADSDGVVAGVQATEHPRLPGQAPTGAQKKNVNVSKVRRSSKLMKWFLARVMLMEHQSVFLPYDGTFHKPDVPQALAHLEVHTIPLFGGFRMTYRRQAVLDTPFDPTLRYYCPGEDLDGSYRISRSGALLVARKAKLHHFVSADARLNRRQVAHLWSLNQAVLIRRHAPDQAWAQGRYKRLMWHRIATDMIKDLGQRRFRLPQTRGSLAALRESGGVFSQSPEDLETWYPARQERIVKGT